MATSSYEYAALQEEISKTGAIHDAVIDGDEDIAGLLVDFGCDLSFKVKGHSALYIAVWKKNAAITELLASTSIAINTPIENESCLSRATATSFYAGMEALLRAGATTEMTEAIRQSHLHTACYMGDQRAVRMLLAYHANVNSTDDKGMTLCSTLQRRAYPR